MILTLLFIWISSEIKFLQRLSTSPSILILIETHILVRYAALSNFPSELKQEQLSTAISAILMVLYMNFSGHPEKSRSGNPDQCQESSFALTALRQSSASGFIWILTGTQGYWREKAPLFPCQKIPCLQFCKFRAIVLLPLTSMGYCLWFLLENLVERDRVSSWIFFFFFFAPNRQKGKDI